MTRDKERLEVVREVNNYKDVIKNSAVKITDSLTSKKIENFDSNILEILNALGKIGTITGNARKVNDYAQTWSDAIYSAKRLRSRGLNEIAIKDLLNQICSISFDINKKGNKFDLKFCVFLREIYLS